MRSLERREPPGGALARRSLKVRWRARYDSRRSELRLLSLQQLHPPPRPAVAGATMEVNGAPGTTRTYDPQLRKTKER